MLHSFQRAVACPRGLSLDTALCLEPCPSAHELGACPWMEREVSEQRWDMHGPQVCCTPGVRASKRARGSVCKCTRPEPLWDGVAFTHFTHSALATVSVLSSDDGG